MSRLSKFQRLATFALTGPARLNSAHNLMRALFCVTATALAALILSAPPLLAQNNLDSGTYVTPFPDGDVYQLQVVGDSLADGLHWVVRDQLAIDARVTVGRQKWTFNSLLSSKFSGNLNNLKRDLKNARTNIVVVMLGAHDRKAVRDASGRWQKVGTQGWRQELSRRVDKMMQTLKDLKVAVYWVGLPAMRRPKANDVAQVINEIVRERAYLRGLKYIDAFTSFADEFGRYSAYGPDLTGKIRLLRERDGMHFTIQGNKKLAHFVERELKRDIKQAKSERLIPLAGAPKEQVLINSPKKDKSKKAPETGWRAAISANAKTDKPTADATSSGFFSANTGGEQSSDDGTISLRSFDSSGREETVKLEIIRPAIPASVVALVTRKQSPDRLSTVGDTLVDQIAGGLSIMSSVSPAQSALGGGARRLSPAQTPFFRVLVKGERTTSKPGRADDFSWPRPEPPPLPKPVIHVPRTDGDNDAGDDRMPLPPRSPFRKRA